MTQTSTTSSAFLLPHITRKQEPLSLPVRYGGFKYKSARRVTRFSSRRNTVKRKVLRAGRSTQPSRRLTPRSTGPIAACRHLGYKILAQIPAHRNGPVNSNVRHRKTIIVHHSRQTKHPACARLQNLHTGCVRVNCIRAGNNFSALESKCE